ncbi:MAG TPA: glutamate-1-semialdehyde 2,1-aminomutase [Terriglobia bacterium]|nr:glutamate-1-semialdehyde 2,1-aminomutase [Terriglobia bacterium]
MPTKSYELFQKALNLMPGGVNSPVRAFRAVGGDPLYIAHGKSSSITDVDGNSYIDYVLSWGPLILGHCHPEVVEALARAIERGTSFGACTEAEIELAEHIRAAYPLIERVRLVNSGTEATLSALRVARAATGREKILKFEGCYHGHGDSLLVKAGSGVATLGLPDSPGVPRALAELTVTVPFNDSAALEEAFRIHGNRLAAVIVEPVVGNSGCIPPQAGFLEKLRKLTAGQGTVLILDEVMTGFRVAYGGAQELFGIQPDLTTLGKIIGGGLPVGAYGGKASLMDLVAPAGPVYQAGTLSGNPLAVTAGLKTLEVLRRPGTYERLEAISDKLASGLGATAAKAGVPLTVNRVGSMFTGFFSSDPVTDYASAKRSDTGRFARFFRSVLERGVYFPPSQFEAAFVSTAHTDADVAATLEAAANAFEEIRN